MSLTPPASSLLPIGLLVGFVPLLQPYSPPAVVPLLILTVLAIAAMDFPAAFDWRRQPDNGLILWFSACSIYILLTSLWAVNGKLALITAISVIGVFVACAILLAALSQWTAEEQRRFGAFLIAGLILGMANVQFMLLDDGRFKVWLQAALLPIIGPQRRDVMPVALDTSMTLIGLLYWPAAMVVQRRFGWVAAAGLYVAVFLLMRQGGSTTTDIAYLIGGLAFIAAYVLPKLTATIYAAVLAGFVGLSPLLLQPRLTGAFTALLSLTPGKEGSFEHRRAIWGFVIGKIAERPILGWGIGNSRAIPGGHEEFLPGVEKLPLHPHDAALQLWLELGGVGTALTILFLIGLVRAVYRLMPDRRDFALAFASLAMATVNAMVSYNLWHEWWLTYLVLTGCLCYGIAHRSKATGFPACG